MLIYVIGRGHSGSTILDIALAQSKNVIGMGELVSGLGPNKICSCGKKAKNCSAWQELHSGEISVSREEMNYLFNESNITNILKYFFSNKKHAKKYLEINHKILEARNKNKEGSVFVDSSKELTRGFILSRNDQNSILIHLVRDPYKVLSSNMHRIENSTGYRIMRNSYKNKSARPILFLIAALNWIIGNVISELIKLYSRDRSIRIRFEDLCMKPDETIEKIEKLSNTDLYETKLFLNGNTTAKITHSLGGNRTKKTKDLTFDKNRALGRDTLTPLERFFSFLIVGPLRKIYGY